ncbi:MAG: DUF928 domain-containing protein [Prochloraceae cyanobacterium]
MKSQQFKLLIISSLALIAAITLGNVVKAERSESQTLENQTEETNKKQTRSSREIEVNPTEISPVVYNAPPDSSRHQKTRTASTRVCSYPIIGDFHLLAPDDHVALTADQNPTFYVYFESIPNTELRYSVGNPDNYITDRRVKISEPGLLPIEINPENKEFPSDLYYLTIGLVCKDGRSRADKFIRLRFVKIDENRLQIVKNSSNSTLETVATLAKDGIWYDALNEAHSLKDKEVFLNLLSQIEVEEVASLKP